MHDLTGPGGYDFKRGNGYMFHISENPKDLSEVVLHCESPTGDALTVEKIVLETEQGTYTGVVNAVFDDAASCNTRRVGQLAHDQCYEYAHDREFVSRLSLMFSRHTEFRGTSYFELAGPSQSHDAWLQECKNLGGDNLAFIDNHLKSSAITDFLKGDLSVAQQRLGTQKRAICGQMSMDLDRWGHVYKCNDKVSQTFGQIDPNGHNFGDWCLSIISTGLETKKVACPGDSSLTGAICEKKLIKGMSRCCFVQRNVPLTKS